MDDKDVIHNNNSISTQRELENCTFIKTILMITIVLYHSLVFWTGTWFIDKPIFNSQVLCYIAKWLNTFHIYTFTFVSGYLFGYIKYEKKRYSDYKKFVINKCKRLLIPYMFASIIWVIPLGTVFFKYNTNDVFHKYILGESPSQLWFLLMLFMVFIIYYPISNFVMNRVTVGFLVIAGFYCIGILGSIVMPNVFMIWTACKYMLFFHLGNMVRVNNIQIIYKIPCLVYIGVDISIFIAMQVLEQFNTCTILFKMCELALYTVVCIVGTFMAFVVLQRIAQRINWNKEAFIKLSEKTMVIYLFHQQVIYFTIYIFNGIVNPYINAGINFVVAITFSLIIATILLKYRFTRFMVGEKIV